MGPGVACGDLFARGADWLTEHGFDVPGAEASGRRVARPELPVVRTQSRPRVGEPVARPGRAGDAPAEHGDRGRSGGRPSRRRDRRVRAQPAGDRRRASRFSPPTPTTCGGTETLSLAVSAGRALRVLAWPGMPASEALAGAAERLGCPVSVSVVVSNEALEAELDRHGAGANSFDLIFPSDYLVERLAASGRLLPLDYDALPLDRLADWSVAAAHDPGCRWSVPFAFGTTGYLTRLEGATSWQDLFDPPARTRVGMLEEVREVVGAALIATGHGPNETSAARARGRPRPAREPAPERRALRQRRLHHSRRVRGGRHPSRVERPRRVGDAPAAAAALRRARRGRGIWITAAAIPVGAPDSVASTALLRELMDPELAALTTLTERLLHPERGGPPPDPGRSARRPGSVPDRGHARPVPSAPRPRRGRAAARVRMAGRRVTFSFLRPYVDGNMGAWRMWGFRTWPTPIRAATCCSPRSRSGSRPGSTSGSSAPTASARARC